MAETHEAPESQMTMDVREYAQLVGYKNYRNLLPIKGRRDKVTLTRRDGDSYPQVVLDEKAVALATAKGVDLGAVREVAPAKPVEKPEPINEEEFLFIPANRASDKEFEKATGWRPMTTKWAAERFIRAHGASVDQCEKILKEISPTQVKWDGAILYPMEVIKRKLGL